MSWARGGRCHLGEITPTVTTTWPAVRCLWDSTTLINPRVPAVSSLLGASIRYHTTQLFLSEHVGS